VASCGEQHLHIRFGAYQSIATSLNAARFEILEHRLSASAVPSVTKRFEPFIGEYKNTERGNVVKVMDQEGTLTLDIPGKMVLGLEEPDAAGIWRSKISEQLYVTFERSDSVPATELRLHQIVRLGRTAAPVSADGIPEELQLYPGTYLLAQAGAEFKVTCESEGLVIHDPLAKRVIRLRPSGKPETWVDEFNKFSIHFEKGSAGIVTAMLLDGATVFRR
jgi:hypothetical protein